mmetsp:Transcript_20734/g.42153  ORF Transcript_20734/g.42153 Transcript_20734/m.42153 type:complete len:89 (-) Transcript_20734:366-632(-)
MGGGTNVTGSLWQACFGGITAKSWKRAKEKGVDGNLKGEGLKLGGVFVIGPGKQGILFEHKEKTWGDNVMTSNEDALKAAIGKLTGAA